VYCPVAILVMLMRKVLYDDGLLDSAMFDRIYHKRPV